MVKARSFPPKGAVEQQLAERGHDKVLPSDDLRDLLVGIIDDNREFVGGNIRTVPNQEVTKINAGVPLDDTEPAISESHRLTIRDPEAPVDPCRRFVSQTDFGVHSPGLGKKRFLSVGCMSGSGDIAAGSVTGVDCSRIAELLPSGEIKISSPALKIGPLIPEEAEPGEIPLASFSELLAASVRVQILNPQENFSASSPCPVPGESESGGMSRMQQACGGRSQPSAVGAGCFQAPTTLTATERTCGARRCSNRKMPCHMPRAS